MVFCFSTAIVSHSKHFPNHWGLLFYLWCDISHSLKSYPCSDSVSSDHPVFIILCLITCQTLHFKWFQMMVWHIGHCIWIMENQDRMYQFCYPCRYEPKDSLASCPPSYSERNSIHPPNFSLTWCSCLTIPILEPRTSYLWVFLIQCGSHVSHLLPVHCIQYLALWWWLNWWCGRGWNLLNSY